MRPYPANIHATLAAGATVTAPYYDVNIVQTLCQMVCADETPVFSPMFSVVSVETVGTSQYLVHLHVEGTISYMPCGGGCCQTKTQVLSQDFSVPVFSAAAISGVTVSAGATQNGIVRIPCKSCSNTFVSDTPVTLTITTA